MRWQAAMTLALWILLGAASPQEEVVRNELENFHGTWTVVSMEMDGKLMSEADRKKIKLTIQGEKFRFHNGEESEPGLYKIDPAKNPHELNIVITEGADKGKVYLVIYKFEGGKMIQCVELANASRPKAFSGKAGSGCALEVWQREKP